MNCKDDIAVAVDGLFKMEVDTPECTSEVVYPIVIQPALTADVSVQQSTRRRSSRTAKKRSLLLPGELENDVNTRISKHCWIVPHTEPAGDNMGNGDENTDDITVSDALPPKKKRTYSHRRKPSTKKNVPADTQSSSESVTKLLGQLVSAYCGDDGHPANCQECKNRVEMIRTVLESSGKCNQHASASSDTAADFCMSAISQEASGNTEITRNGLFSCAKCSDRFDTFDELQKHQGIHSAGRKKCDVCHRYLAANTSMAAHLRTHTGEKPHVCGECGASFAAAKTLREHRLKHTGQRPYQCTQCDRAFLRKSVLSVHLSTHTAHRPHVCQLCDKAFAQRGILNQHWKAVHSAEHRNRAPCTTSRRGRLQTCPDCGKTLSGRSSMKHHRFLHTGARPYACSVCSRRFTRYQHLLDHAVRHTGSRPHVCDQCGARFSRRSSLKVHERLHTGELPFTCEICGASFAQSSNLRQHTRSAHTRDKPYVCSFCGDRFMWAKDRTLHERRRHTHDRPFSCDVCARQFLTNYELGLHKKSRHGGADGAVVRRRHCCPQCPASFAKKSSLVRHAARVHFTAGQQWPVADSPASGHHAHAWSTDRDNRRRPGVKSDESCQHHCPHCELSFPRLAALSRHVRTHFGVSECEDEDE